MARPLRIEFAGAFYHVMARGNDKQNIFFGNNDYHRFLDILSTTCQRHYWRVHAYCLMSNHYHLLLETPLPNLSKGMQQLDGSYTQHINRCYQRCGHVFQGRFVSRLIDTEQYYKTLLRYVLQNPVAAGIVNHAGDYSWSSYQSVLGKQSAPKWLVAAEVLAHFHNDTDAAIQAFTDFLMEFDDTDIWQHLTNQIFLGDAHFAASQLAKLPANLSTNDIPLAQLKPNPLTLAEYQQQYPTRDAALVAAFTSGAYSMTALASYFGLHVSTVSRKIAKSKA